RAGSWRFFAQLLLDDRRVEVERVGRHLDRPRSYVLFGERGYGLFGHLALALVGQQAGRFLEGEPAHLGDLVAKGVAELAEPAALVPDEEEGDHFEDAFALPVEPVADVAELADRPATHAGLLRDLAQSGR